jgi:tRNA(Ile)-lysidine synthase
MGFSLDRLLLNLERFPRPPCYWVALSGGLDSSVLLHALAGLRQRLPAALKALHLDHGLQTNSKNWAVHCRRVCAALQIPLVVKALQLRTPNGASIEAEAREARLAAYRDIMEPGDLVLTAQHRDDQAETLLLQLLRGSGLSGLAAMPEVLKLPPGYLARPLLDFTRSELRQYAKRNCIDWVDDPSNVEIGFDRNYLRHEVLPLLAQRWPGCAKTLSRSARHCAEAQDLIDHLADRDMARMQGSRPGTLSVSALLNLEPPLCRALLRRWIRSTGFTLPNSRRLDGIIHNVLAAAPDRSPMVHWSGAEVRRYRDDLFLLPPLPERPGPTALDGAFDSRLALPAGLGVLYLKFRASRAVAHNRRGHDLVQVRFGVSGARCGLAMRRQHKSLKKLFQELDVPDWVRPYVPLVYVNDCLRAVGDLCLCTEKGVSSADFRVSWAGHPFATAFAPRMRNNQNFFGVDSSGD